eukprot:TRINITY_DN630_c0_g1_i2.p1 TRINITY_DN630_c0_g1~~TRINITY_DN630_c0_g1_i2.p1  ORF type:complete len:470 (+),score=137.70 TRINITY_DN630_c0_g1_i2:116-1525(+)
MLASRSFLSSISRQIAARGILVRSASTAATTGTQSRSSQSTTLSNGIRVVSVNGGAVTPVSSIGVFVEGGSRSETKDTIGSTHFLKHLAFQSNHSRSALQFIRELEGMGVTLNTSAAREFLSFTADTLPDDASRVLSILGELLHPRLEYFEVERAKAKVGEESARLLANPQTRITELLLQEAFRNKGLGRPLIAPEFAIHDMNNESLRSFASGLFTPAHTVVVGVNVPHGELVSGVEAFDTSSSSSSSSSSKQAASQYRGGDARVLSHGNSHVAIAFEAAPARDTRESLAFTLLQGMLGSASTKVRRPAPGSGLTSRLAQNVLASNPWVHQVSAFNLAFSDGGVFGVYGEAQAGRTGSLAQALAVEVSRAVKGSSDQAEFARAKAALRANLLQSAESPRGVVDFVARQVVGGSGKVSTPEELAAVADALSAEDIKKAASRILGSNPTVVAIGDAEDLPTQAEIKAIVGK